jgi:hypothetical protein
MKTFARSLFFSILLFSLAACNLRPARLTQSQVIDIAWNALEPNTSSQNRNNWEILQAEKVNGLQVVDQFGDVVYRKCPGPALPENLAIRASSEYWYIKAIPIHLLEGNQKIANSPDGLVPEPILQEATFLIDPFKGQVVARKFFCGE